MDASVQLVKTAPAAWQRSQTSLLARWHLLSLDAPCVAVAWTFLVARATHTPLPPAIPAAMFLAVWIVYAADRLFDAARPTEACEPRHRFHHHHRRTFIIAIAVATLALLPLAAAIPWPMLKLYLTLAVLLLIWFAIVHTRSRPLPKELLPGIFFAAAAFLPVWSNTVPQRPALAVAALAYAALVSLNCCCIYHWEHNHLNVAHPTTRFVVRHLQILLLALAVAASASAASTREAPIFLPTALSAGLLLILHQIRNRLDPTDLRAAADLVLLTPFLVLATLR